ncbi:hypothetical protein DZC30_10935 [Comamonas testosteroni]|uniref:Uncharacterized protein n=1 Tax=Comamonas testosteroni TaxID=285 RepID=A0A373FMJ6_COMTE|nr:hypothetical protein DZC30_10935 [Comamonas testosteroni]
MQEGDDTLAAGRPLLGVSCLGCANCVGQALLKAPSAAAAAPRPDSPPAPSPWRAHIGGL